MDPISILVTAISDRAPEYVLLIILGGLWVYMWLNLQGGKKEETGRAKEFASQLEKTAKAVENCQVDHRTSNDTMARQFSAFQLEIARNTPSRTEVKDMIRETQATVTESLDEIRSDLRWLRDRMGGGKS
ncbi:hypothetical protein [Acidiphilium angustum]|uniref:hypothetical protein n=1 Tax=Acidiphilium angustum TaxID=523 RepID=UPI00049439ED|nr:hypothetical protein [Acidiphilium angustum]